MKKTYYFKSSLVLAASGLSVSASHGSEVYLNYGGPANTVTSGSTLNFDVTGDSASDYTLLFAASSKPQITTFNFNTATPTINEVFLNSIASDDGNTLPVLALGTTINSALVGTLGGTLNNQGFFYQNWNNNRWGDWAGPGGTSAPGSLVGPITGYVGLAIPTSSALTDFNYGYAHITVDMTAGAPYITLLDTGYETTVDQGITTTAPVPEPTSAALLAAGAAGLLALRRRRSLR
jgi:PEP-CTERM motif